MKSLKTIQIFSKIGKIVSTICYIASMIGAIGCAVGAGLVGAFGEKALSTAKQNMDYINDEETRNAIEHLDVKAMIWLLVAAAIICVGGTVVSKFAQKYFKNELADGTPFTTRGADELKRLGIIDICVNLGASIAAGGIYETLVKSSYPEAEDFKGVSIGMGIIFLIVSVIFRYGASILEGQNGTTAEVATQEAAPVEAAPVEAAPVEAAPVEAAPVEAAPVEAAPVEAAPVEAAPVEAAPVEAAPVEAAPVEAAPVEAAPVEAAPEAPTEV